MMDRDIRFSLGLLAGTGFVAAFLVDAEMAVLGALLVVVAGLTTRRNPRPLWRAGYCPAPYLEKGRTIGAAWQRTLRHRSRHRRMPCDERTKRMR